MTYYKLNKPDVSVEFFENEALVLNTQNGRYFGIKNSGITILALLLNGSSAEELEAILLKKHNIATEDLKSYIHDFITELLVNEVLLTSTESIKENTDVNAEFNSLALPTIEVHSDMEDLVFLS